MNDIRFTLFAYFLILAIFPPKVSACAGCRNPNMPVSRVESMGLRAGEFRIGSIIGATTLHVVHQAGCSDISNCNEIPVQPLYLHDQQILPGELRAVGEFGFTNSIGLELQLPFRIVRTSISYTTPDGQTYEPLDPGIHHRHETLVGLGDSWLLTRWAGKIGGLLIAARVGFSIPLGRTESNPFELGSLGREHQHIQFGTGTFDPILAIDLSRLFGNLILTGYMQVQASLYQNSHGFRSGIRNSEGLQIGRRIWGSITGAFGIEGLHEAAERWEDKILQDGNLGRSEILISISFMKSFRTSSLGFSARIPVYRHIEQGDDPTGKLSSPLMLGLNYSHTFSL